MMLRSQTIRHFIANILWLNKIAVSVCSSECGRAGTIPALPWFKRRITFLPMEESVFLCHGIQYSFAVP